MHKVVAALSKFGNGRRSRAYGLAWVDKRLCGQQRYIAITPSKNYDFSGRGEDEFKFLEEDPNTSFGVRRFYEKRNKRF